MTPPGEHPTLLDERLLRTGIVRPSIAGPKWVALGPTALLGALVRFRIGESNEARSPAGCEREAGRRGRSRRGLACRWPDVECCP